METKPEELLVNGVAYVPKENVEELKLNTEKYCIVRDYNAGVFAGILVERKGKEVKMADARRIWYWDGAASLSQLAVDGTSKPENCKFPVEVKEILLLEAIEIIPCTVKAQKSIQAVPIWKS